MAVFKSVNRERILIDKLEAVAALLKTVFWRSTIKNNEGQ